MQIPGSFELVWFDWNALKPIYLSSISYNLFQILISHLLIPLLKYHTCVTAPYDIIILLIF